VGLSNITSFLSGLLQPQKIKFLKSFLGKQHSYQCKLILGKEFSDVHKIIDKRIGGGKTHRIHDHNISFINKKFKKKDEKSAAYLHLLGDFVSDIIPNVLEAVLKEIDKKTISAPNYGVYNKKNSWNIKKISIDKMCKTWSEAFVDTLNKNYRLKDK